MRSNGLRQAKEACRGLDVGVALDGDEAQNGGTPCNAVTCLLQFLHDTLQVPLDHMAGLHAKDVQVRCFQV